MKIAICAIIKQENLYLREWVEYHKKLGFDKIFLYDNNNVNGEYPHQVIGDYIMDGYVKVHNVRGFPFVISLSGGARMGLQSTVYNKCRIENKKEYDWMAFIDVDEFITIGKDEPQDIHLIFEKYGYADNGFEQVLMSWYTIGSGGKTHYEDRPVQERFIEHKDIEDTKECKTTMSDYWVKSIVKTDIPDDKLFKLGNEHSVDDLYSCSEYGLYIPLNNIGECCRLTYFLHNILYVRHYFSKSLWEHISRRVMRRSKDENDMRMHDFKSINGWNDYDENALNEFMNYIENQEQIKF